MAGSVNKCILIGNVTKDPDIRRTQSGQPIANFSLATNETWRDKRSGERKEKAEFHRIVVFSEGLAKVVESYVKKGTRLYVEGQLQTRRWQDQQGQDRYSTEIVLQGYNATLTILDGGKSKDDQSGYGQSGGYGGDESDGYGATPKNAYAEARGGKPFDKKIDEEIPF